MPVNVLKSVVLVYAVSAALAPLIASDFAVPIAVVKSDLAVSTKLLVFAVVEYLLNSLLNALVKPVVGV